MIKTPPTINITTINKVMEQLMKLWVITIPALTIILFIMGLISAIFLHTTWLFWLILSVGFVVWISGMLIIDKFINNIVL